MIIVLYHTVYLNITTETSMKCYKNKDRYAL